MSRKKKHKTGCGGWPKHHSVPPVVVRHGRTRLSAEGPLALQRLAGEVGTQSADDSSMAQRLQCLRALLSTDRRLARLCPRERDVAAAVAEWREANPALRDAPEESEEFRQALFAHVIPKVFDDDSMDKLREAVIDRLMTARGPEEADALALALLFAAGGVTGENPLLQLLVSLTCAEADSIGAVFDALGLPTDGEGLRRLAEEPGELDRIAREPDTARKIERLFRQDPALRRAGERAAREAEELLFTAVAEGSTEAHLDMEELAPLTDGLQDLFKRYGLDKGEELPEEEVGSQMAKLLMGFADDPATRPAFARFAEVLQDEARRAAGGAGKDAIKLRMLSDLWGKHWREDSYLRSQAVYASLERVIKERAEPNDGGEGGMANDE